MVKRNLTLAEFCKLSGEEQLYQYKDLSEREKFEMCIRDRNILRCPSGPGSFIAMKRR